jgi:hypothetical protein
LSTDAPKRPSIQVLTPPFDLCPLISQISNALLASPKLPPITESRLGGDPPSAASSARPSPRSSLRSFHDQADGYRDSNTNPKSVFECAKWRATFYPAYKPGGVWPVADYRAQSMGKRGAQCQPCYYSNYKLRIRLILESAYSWSPGVNDASLKRIRERVMMTLENERQQQRSMTDEKHGRSISLGKFGLLLFICWSTI